MAASKQDRNQAPPEIAGAAGDDHADAHEIDTATGAPAKRA
jgi:hypothetical protein